MLRKVTKFVMMNTAIIFLGCVVGDVADLEILVVDKLQKIISKTFEGILWSAEIVE